ncbi:MAG: biopolymer transporter ExbD [Verrucomicrobiota bacterium]
MARPTKELFAETYKTDMSPMIDLVFLLLIFFMISSTLITYQKDERVKIPVASAARVPNLVENRVILNVYEDGLVRDESGTKVYEPGQVEALMAGHKASNPKIRLHLRADKRVTHDAVKKVVAASARGGVTNVIFSTYVTAK